MTENKEMQSMDEEVTLFQSAKKVLVGGVCSSTRLNRATGQPFFARSGNGSRVLGYDNKEYIDCCCSHGAVLLGHNSPDVNQAIRKSLDMGTLCSYETEYHQEVARKICRLVPCAEKVRFTNSGTEATMHLLRACRAYTGKDKIIRFEGHFHGYHDYVYIGGHTPLDYLKSGNRVPYRESEGIPEEMTKYVISIPFNDTGILEKTIKKHRDQVACVILEPINYNSGCIVPSREYMKIMRGLTKENNILLFYDEIQSCFKIGAAGAQGYYGIIPDVCTLGKALGGGVPLSAMCGRKEIMDLFRPVGNVEHSGTFNAHLYSIMAANAFLDIIAKEDFYSKLEALCLKLHGGIECLLTRSQVKGRIQYLGARFGLFFGIDKEVTNYRESVEHDKGLMLRFIREMADRGVYFHDYGGSACHHGISIAHTQEDIDKILNASEDTLKVLQESK